jgi:hypothetical protein
MDLLPNNLILRHKFLKKCLIYKLKLLNLINKICSCKGKLELWESKIRRLKNHMQIHQIHHLWIIRYKWVDLEV